MSNAAWIVVARKELRDALRSRLLMGLLCFLCGVIALSAVVSAIDFHSKLDDYQNYVAALRQAHSSVTPQPPRLFPLQLLIGGLEYLEIVGALVAIIVGYGMVAKERTRGTLELLFTRPLRRFDLAGGKVFALAVLWLCFVLAAGAVMAGVLVGVGGATLSADELVRIGIVCAMTWLYLILWSSVALGFAAHMRRLPSALIAGLVVWLVVVLILPQIGDTMDPDNQIPGGLFASLQATTDQQNAVMAHFTSYETGRTIVESASMEKHYERAVFGVTGITDTYVGKSLGFVIANLWSDIVVVVAGTVAAIAWALSRCTRKQLVKKESR